MTLNNCRPDAKNNYGKLFQFTQTCDKLTKIYLRTGVALVEAELRLSKPTKELREEYLSFYNDWKESGETMVPWVITMDPTDFDALLQFFRDNESGENIPEGWVKDSTYWLVNESNKVLGAVNIRHSLTQRLLERGGHVGYGIRPTERQKGYATKLLSLSLEVVRELGIKKVLVTCDATNIGSLKTILNNGGVPDEDFIEEDGNVVKRFWIEL
ncbi:GNAT family N-acetyltransferase [Pseudoneobacillus sp. C159]